MKLYCCDIYIYILSDDYFQQNTIESTSVHHARVPRSTQALPEVGVVALCGCNLV